MSSEQDQAQPWVTCTESFGKFGHTVFESCKQTDIAMNTCSVFTKMNKFSLTYKNPAISQ